MRGVLSSRLVGGCCRGSRGAQREAARLRRLGSAGVWGVRVGVVGVVARRAAVGHGDVARVGATARFEVLIAGTTWRGQSQSGARGKRGLG